MEKITDEMKYMVSEGDVITIHDASWDYSKRIGEPFAAIVLWCGIHGQPLITKMGEYKPFWSSYASIVKIDGHINLDRLFGTNQEREKNMKYESKTVEISLSKEEFDKLKTVNQLDRVIFLNESSKECFTVYNLVDNSDELKEQKQQNTFTFPCKTGDIIYTISMKYDMNNNYMNIEVVPAKIEQIVILENNYTLMARSERDGSPVAFYEIEKGIKWFLSQEKAEAGLKYLREKIKGKYKVGEE